MNKITIIGIFCLLILASGCTGTTPKPNTPAEGTETTVIQEILATRSQDSNQNGLSGETASTTGGSAQLPDQTSTLINDNRQTGTEANPIQGTGNTQPNNNPPFISGSSLNPSNPSLGKSFSLTITGQDDLGVMRLAWETENVFSNQPSTGTFECTGQTSCSNTWEFITTQEGLNRIQAYAVDSSGQQSEKRLYEITVGPYQAPRTSTNQNTTNANTSTQNTNQGTASTVNASNECNSNSDCGYKQICTVGTCSDVECTNNSQCSGCRRCSDNSCVSCGSGPYGCYC